jgi:hypothetical protein
MVPVSPPWAALVMRTGTVIRKTRLSISLAFSLSGAMVSMMGHGY